MNDPDGSLWLGYGQAGGRTSLRHDELGGRLLLLGQKANELAALVAYACKEAGLRVLIVDADGSLTEKVSGYFKPYDFTHILYDVCQLEEEGGAMHAQLLAAAYTAALDLSSEEEWIVNAAMQVLADQDNMANPPVLFDKLNGLEGFRGFYVDKLKGRIGSLKDFDAAKDGVFVELLNESSIVSFTRARYPQFVDLAVALLIAKLLAVIPNARTRPDLVIINDAHHIFKASPKIQHSNRLLTHLFEAQTTVVLASHLKHVLNQQVIDGCPVKIVSSEVWNEEPENARVLPNSFVIDHGHYGHSKVFVARAFEPKTAEPISGGFIVGPEPELTRLILEDVRSYEAPTRPSLIAYLSGHFPSETVERELIRLHLEGFLKLETKEVRSGPPMLVYSLTEKGQRYLEGMSR